MLGAYEAGDIVWVQDYHLMLLPAIIKAARPKMKVGWFLHTPFPSSEMYRMLPMREAVLRAVLRADLIGARCAFCCCWARARVCVCVCVVVVFVCGGCLQCCAVLVPPPLHARKTKRFYLHPAQTNHPPPQKKTPHPPIQKNY